MTSDYNKPSSASKLRCSAEERLASQLPPESIFHNEMLLHELQVHQIELEMQNDELRREIDKKNEYATHLRTIIDNSLAGYFRIDLEGRFLDVNDAWLRMHLYGSKEEVIGRHFSIMQLDSASDSALSHVAELKQGKPIPYGEFKSRRKDGSVGYHIFSAHPVVSSDQIVGYEWFIIDISDRKQAELSLLEHNRQLVAAKIAADSANLAKSRFLANMSHEIRTPLNGVLGMAQLLESTELTQEQQEYLHILKNSGRHLTQLISDILDLSKIESHHVKLEERGFNLETELAAIVSVLSLRARDKGLRLDLLIDTDVPLLLKGDALRLRQIISNLVGNAIKFTANGFVSLHISKETGDDLSTSLLFVIKDSGVGISSDKLENIFEPFTQADNSTTRKYGGTGLGLTISRQLIGLMGGSITAKSTEGDGATFCFTAVFRRQVPGAGALTAPETAEFFPKHYKSTVKNICILLVEDDPANKLVTGTILTKLGYRVITADNGREALDLLAKNDFDLVLMDCMMPIMNGYDATAVIRDRSSNVRNHAIPVIALTANAFNDDRDTCLAAGMDDYLSKPTGFEDLLAMAAKWTER